MKAHVLSHHFSDAPCKINGKRECCLRQSHVTQASLELVQSLPPPPSARITCPATVYFDLSPASSLEIQNQREACELNKDFIFFFKFRERTGVVLFYSQAQVNESVC